MSEVSPEEKFQTLFKSFKEEDRYKYRERLAKLSSEGSTSLVVNFMDLDSFDHELALNVIQTPEEYLGYANKAALEQLKSEDPDYAEAVEGLFVRFQNLPEKTPLRRVDAARIGKLIMIDGIVIRASPVRPLITKAVYKCLRCKLIVSVEQKGARLSQPIQCQRCGKRNFTLLPSESTFINTQRLRMQERPEELPPGQLPRWIDISLSRDMVDMARPGDRIYLTAIVRGVQQRTKLGRMLKTFDLFLEANYVDVSARRFERVEITPKEEERIRKLAKDPFIIRTLTRSIAPSIYGYEYIKEAILYSICSGVPKHPQDMNIRGDIHALLIGDPATAKSQLLRYVANLSPRAIYTTGRGSTAAGLTAAVLRDQKGGMALEAGALVLADRGTCAIDEFDKMGLNDRTAIHEAMEQQTVSIAKGGIVAILNARTSILAAANPKLGRYDANLSVAQNVNLPATILSRFDLIFIIRDVPRGEEDKMMAEHITKLHRGESTAVESLIPQELLAKYLAYARTLKPKLTEEAAKRLEEFYLKMRGKSATSDSPVAITARQHESLIRLAEARAKSALRDEVTVEDAEAVINLFKVSLRQVGIDIETGKYDIDILMTGKPKSARDKMRTILTVIGERSMSEEELYRRLSEYAMDRMDAERCVQQLVKDGIIFQPRKGFYKKV